MSRFGKVGVSEGGEPDGGRAEVVSLSPMLCSVFVGSFFMVVRPRLRLSVNAQQINFSHTVQISEYLNYLMLQYCIK